MRTQKNRTPKEKTAESNVSSSLLKGEGYFNKEEAQQQSEFLQSILESVTHPFYVIDAKDYTIKMANSAAGISRMTGSATCYALIHRTDKPCHSEDHPCPLEMIRKTKKPVTTEHIHYDKDGNTRNVEIHGFPIFDSQGNVAQMIEYCLDITERKQAEEALRLHDLRLQALLDLNKMAGASHEKILDFVREEMIKITQSKFGFISFMSEDESVMIVDNWSKETMAKCAIVDTPMHFPMAKAGLWGEAVRQRKAVIVNDYTAKHPAKKGYPKGHVPIKRFLCIPVFDGNHIVMVAAVGNKETDYDESDVRALTSMMNDAWHLMKQKQTEKSLKEETGKAAKYLDIAEVILIVTNTDQTVELINRKGCEILGYPQNEIVGRNWFDNFLPEKLREDAKAAFMKLMAGEIQVVEYCENPIITKNGQERIIAWHNTLVQNEMGKIIGTLSSGEDITERRIAEKQISKILERITDAFVSVDRSWHYTYVNNTAAKLLSKTREEMLGNVLWDVFPEFVGSQFDTEFHRAITENEPVHFETFYPPHDAWYECHCYPSATGLSIFFTDFTERRQKEEQIENLAKFPSENPNPVLRVNKDGVLLYANDASGSILADWDCSVGQTIPPNLQQIISDVLNSGTAKRIEIEHVGRTFAFIVVTVANAGYVNFYGRDITERKQAEQDRETLLHDIGERVKKLNCLYGLSKLVEKPNISLEEILQKTSELLIPSWQFPDITCARIVFDDKEFKTENFKASEWKQSAVIEVHGKKAGVVEVYYLEQKPESYEGPFLKEERDLIKAIAERLGRITERKHMEKALREAHDQLEFRIKERTIELTETIKALQLSESRLAEAQRIAHLGNWDWDIIRNQLWWSDEVYRIFGLEPKQFGATYDAFLSYVHPADRKLVEESVDKALYEGQVYNIDHRVVRPDGSERIVNERAEVIYDSKHRPVKMIGTVYDITEQKKAEDEIRLNQRELRALTTKLQIAEEKERRRIAQDLHDSIGQILSFSGRELKALQKSFPEKTAKSIQEITNQIDSAVEQTRTLSFDLSPSTLYDLGFEVAIEELVDRTSKERKIRCRFENCQSPKPLTDDVKVLLYRAVRELLINSVKHANAGLIKVSLLRAGSDIYINVEDDGEGFDTNILNIGLKKTKGFGIFSIRERLKHIGGHLKIESVKGKGTKAVLIAPLDVENED